MRFAIHHACVNRRLPPPDGLDPQTEGLARLKERLLEQAGDMILVTDAAGTIVYVNEAFRRGTGWCDAELLGRKPSLLKSGVHEPGFYARLWSDLSAGRDFSAVFTNRRKDGTLFLEEKVIAPVLDAAGRPTHFVAVGRDVTSRETLARALRCVSEGTAGQLGAEFFPSLVTLLARCLGADSAVVAVPSGDGAMRSLAFWAEGGLQPEAVISATGTPCAAVAAGAELLVGEGLGERFPEASAVRVLGMGSYAGVPLRDLRGGVLGVLCVMRRGPLPGGADVLGLLRIFAARAAAELERREADERFRQIASAVTQVFWMTDIQKNAMVYVSPGYESIWGRSVESLYREPRSWLDSIHPADRERVLAAATNKQVLGEYDEEYRILRPDGALRVVRDRAFPVRDPAGRVVRVCGVAEDVTDRRAVQAELVRAQADLAKAQKLDALGQLAGGIAHDFNNILTVIKGSLDLLSAPTAAGSAASEDLRDALDAVRRGIQLTGQLLSFSRHRPVQCEEVDLSALAAGTMDMLRRLLPQAVTIETRFAAGLPPVKGDRGQLQQVVMNLVLNARDAMPEGGTMRVSVEAEEGHRLVLRVEDTGCGMEAGVRARLFEPFFTTKPDGRGTGLGLATVYGIVTRLGGSVEVDSGPGRGSRFAVLLPAAPPPAAEGAEGTRPRILVIDDEPAMRRVMERYLARAGMEAVSAAGGDEAVRAAAGGLSLAVVDVRLGRESGRAVAARLRAADPGLPILYCTGFADEELDGPFIEKPFDEDSFLRAVRRSARVAV